MSKKRETQLEELQNKVVDLENQLKRAVADYQNLEKRVNEGRSELSQWATTGLIKRLLPVLDHLETVVEKGQQVLSEHCESKDWVKGVELAVKELKSVLQSEGLDEIAADGQFDPSLHEAVDVREMPPSPASGAASLDSSGEPKDNMILEVVRKGYNLNDKVLRPAQVVVGRSTNNNPERVVSEPVLSEVEVVEPGVEG
mgnify:CR=1 FL=1